MAVGTIIKQQNLINTICNAKFVLLWQQDDIPFATLIENCINTGKPQMTKS